MTQIDDKDEFYTVSVLCTNCRYGSPFNGHSVVATIKKGVTTFNHIKEMICPKCGCQTMQIC